MDYYPSLLLMHVRSVRGVSGLDADELREIAAEHWPSMDAESIGRIVERAIEQRDAGQRRIDPKTVDLKHPRAREAEMATLTTGRLRSWLRERLEADPEIDNDTLEALANQEFGASNVSRRSLGQNAGAIRREMEAQPSTRGNGAKPEQGPAPDATAAAAVFTPQPAGEESSVPELSIERSRRTPGRMDVRLALLDVSPLLALRIGAAVANAAEYELREGAA